ncbi:MAG: type III pantothenate kinase [Candidatus Omnitrophica bacterium]|nr:type III pantothenate kinase [Candidatus Omnitrophota bacterium]
MRLLAVDIGNTNITLGAFKDNTLLHEWRIASRPFRTFDEYGAVLSQILKQHDFEPERMIVGSVVPTLEEYWIQVGENLLVVEVRVIHPGKPDLLPLHIDHPEEAGVDRIVDTWAALQKFPPPLLVIDFGTATTFDVASPEGYYCGGIILPGLELGAEALFQKTALLPQVSVRKPPSVIGSNTVDCIRSGLYFGWLEMIRGLAERIKKEFDQPVQVITTGGLSRVFAEDADFVDHIEPHLTLEGLCGIDRNWEELSKA